MYIIFEVVQNGTDQTEAVFFFFPDFCTKKSDCFEYVLVVKKYHDYVVSKTKYEILISMH